MSKPPRRCGVQDTQGGQTGENFAARYDRSDVFETRLSIATGIRSTPHKARGA